MNTRRGRSAIIWAGLLFLAGFLPGPYITDAQAGIAGHVVINEVAVDSVTGTGGTEDDWVELYNPTASDVALTGWTLQKFAGTGSSLVKLNLSGTIGAGQHLLIVRNGAATSQSLKDAADLLLTDTFSLSSNNILYLANSNVSITPGGTNANIVDLVGWGTSLYYEGTVAAPDPAETKSIARTPAGEDTDHNNVDLILQNTPTPESAIDTTGDPIEGDVLLTILPAASPVRALTSASAEIVFTVNAAANVYVAYGPTAAYGLAIAPIAVPANTEQAIVLSGLQSGQTYHYSIRAEAIGETDATADATFTTMATGIRLDALVMTKPGARANGAYADGWEWRFEATIWDPAETALKLKFAPWSGPATVAAGGNMQFSADNGMTWVAITADNAYPATGADLSGIDLSTAAGRQVDILVRMKIPAGTPMGNYASSYGILTE